MNTPLVSIVIPVFNRSGLIGECVESALAQSYRNIEVIVSDNCSTDGTQEIVGRYARVDQRVQLLESPTNLGPVRNWLRGLQAAKGTYCKLLFSDDLLHPTAIATQIMAMSVSTTEAAFSSALVGARPWIGSVMYQSGKDIDRLSSHSFIARSLVRSSAYPVSPCAYIFNRERYTAILAMLAQEWNSNDQVMMTGAGLDLLSILFYMSDVRYLTYTNTPLVFFRAHPGSITLKSNNIFITYREARNWFIKTKYGSALALIFRCALRAKVSISERTK